MKWAKVFNPPIRRNLDYCAGPGRKTFIVEPLPFGVLWSDDWTEDIKIILEKEDEEIIDAIYEDA